MAAVRASVVNPDSLARDAVKQAPLVRNCHSLLPQRRCDVVPRRLLCAGAKLHADETRGPRV